MLGKKEEKSDIDVMVVIDEMKPNDLKEYKKVLKEIGNYDKSCGFICGSKELLNWNPQEICHLLNSTANYYGVLEDFVPKYNRRDIADYIKMVSLYKPKARWSQSSVGVIVKYGCF